MKIFGIGLNRTGTTTLGHCLKELGYTVKDNDFNLLKSVKDDILEPIWDIIDEYDAFEDFPWPFIYKKVYNKYPTAKYILTTHTDVQSWLRSQIRHAIYGKPKVKWNAIRHNLLAYGYPYPVTNEKAYTEIYRKHNEEVRDFFSNKENFIELCWAKGDGWEELCSFLNVDVPNIEFPHSYKSDWSMYNRLYKSASKYPDRFFPKYSGELEYIGD